MKELGLTKEYFNVVAMTDNYQSLGYNSESTMRSQSEAIEKAKEWFSKGLDPTPGTDERRKVGIVEVFRTRLFGSMFEDKNMINRFPKKLKDLIFRVNETYPLGERVVQKPIEENYEKGGSMDDLGNPTDKKVLNDMEVFIENEIPKLDKEIYFTDGMLRKQAKKRFYEKYEYGAYNPRFSFDFAKGGKIEAEWLVVLEDKDGYEIDEIVFAKSEDEAYNKAEKLNPNSNARLINMLTDYNGRKVEYAKGGKIDVKIKDWYTTNYSTDDLGEELNKTNTFEDLYNSLNEGDDVYNTMGVGDSLIRERLFEHLAKIKGVTYDFIYQKWLGQGMITDEEIKSMYAKGGKTDDVIMIKIGGDKKYPYYIKKIDTTHMSMANNKDGVDVVVPSHILQHKGESYYDDVRSWLRGGTSPDGKSYDSDYYQRGGKVEKKGNEMIMGGLAGILLGIFLNK